jgi:hypothetical protein
LGALFHSCIVVPIQTFAGFAGGVQFPESGSVACQAVKWVSDAGHAGIAAGLASLLTWVEESIETDAQFRRSV